MNDHIRSILDELYALDPSFASQEKELIPILETLLAHRPDATPDPAFVQNLRMLLRERASEQQTLSLFFSFFTMNRFAPAFAGALLGILITGPVVYSFVRSDTGTPLFTNGNSPESASFSYEIQPTSDQAFGNLSDPDIAISNATSAQNPMMPGRGQGGGGGGDAISTDSKLIAPDMYPSEIIDYNITFEGELPALTDQEVAVLKRQKGSAVSASSFLNAMNLGMINIGSFANMKADSITLFRTPHSAT